MLRVSRYHSGITIVSTHSRPTPRLPVFILHTFYVVDVIFCIIIRTNKYLLDYVTSTQITLFTCIHYAYFSYTLDNDTMYPQFYVIQCYVGTCNNTDIECCQLCRPSYNFMLRVSRYHGITIVSTHSRPTPRLPVFYSAYFFLRV